MKFSKRTHEYLFGIALGIIAIAAVYFFWKNNFLLTAILLFETIAAFYFWNEKIDYFFFLAGFIAGPITEITAISGGAWNYSNPLFLGIPLWLPFLWGLAILLIKRILQAIVGFEIKL